MLEDRYFKTSLEQYVLCYEVLTNFYLLKSDQYDSTECWWWNEHYYNSVLYNDREVRPAVGRRGENSGPMCPAPAPTGHWFLELIYNWIVKLLALHRFCNVTFLLYTGSMYPSINILYWIFKIIFIRIQNNYKTNMYSVKFMNYVGRCF